MFDCESITRRSISCLHGLSLKELAWPDWVHVAESESESRNWHIRYVMPAVLTGKHNFLQYSLLHFYVLWHTGQHHFLQYSLLHFYVSHTQSRAWYKHISASSLHDVKYFIAAPLSHSSQRSGPPALCKWTNAMVINNARHESNFHARICIILLCSRCRSWESDLKEANTEFHVTPTHRKNLSASD